MAIESNLAGIARVAFEAQTGEFNRDVAHAESTYRTATSGMSDAAIKLELAEARLQRQIARGPANYQALARAELQVRRAEAELAAESRRTSSALETEERRVGSLTRGALAGSGALHGLGRAAAFASGTFLAGGGLVFAIRSAVSDATNLHEQLNKTEQVFGSSSNEVVKWSHDSAQALGLAHDKALEYASSFGALLRPLGVIPRQAADVSTTLTQLGGDLASFYNTSVEDALQAIQSGLVGQVRPLRRYGVALDEARVKEEALAETGKERASQLTAGEKALARYRIILHDTALAQGDFARTSDGLANQERILQANIHDLSEGIGGALYPEVNKLIHIGNAWLDNSENQKRVQEEVTKAVKEGAQIVHGAVDAWHAFSPVIHAVTQALGGVEHAAEAALIIGLLRKAQRAAGGFGLISSASTRTRNVIVANSVAEVAAIEKVTLAEREAAAASSTIVPFGASKGLAGKLGRGGLGAAGIALSLTGNGDAQNLGTAAFLAATGNPELAAAYLAITEHKRVQNGADWVSKNVFGQKGKPSAGDITKIAQGLIYSGATDEQIAKQAAAFDALFPGTGDALLREVARLRGQPGGGFHGHRAPPPKTSKQRNVSPPTADLPRALTDAANRAQLTASLDDDLKAAQAEQSFLEKQLARTKKGTKLYSDILAALVDAHSQVESAQSALDAENKRHDEASAAAARKRKEQAAKRAREYRDSLSTRESTLRRAVDAARSPAQRERREDALIAFLKRETNDVRLTAKERERYRTLLQKARDDETKAEQKDKENTLANAVKRAEIAVEKATKGTAAYDKAIAAEKKALDAEISFEERLAKNAKTAAERQAATSKELADKKKLAQLGKTTATTKDAGALTSELLTALQQIESKYAPNFSTSPTVAPDSHPLHGPLHVLIHETRAMHATLKAIHAGGRHTETQFAIDTAKAAFRG